MKEPLKNMTIAITGDFGGGDGGKTRNHKNMQRWIEVNGGRFTTNVTSDVTYLISSYEEWKKKSSKVKQALQQSTPIITYDWLEDSLHAKRPKGVRPYLLKTYEAQQRKQEKMQKRTVDVAMKNVQDGGGGGHRNTLIETTLATHYHIYRDDSCFSSSSSSSSSSSFEYSILLTRPDRRRRQQQRRRGGSMRKGLERHYVKIHQSNARPHLYCVTTRYTRPGLSTSTQLLCPLASLFEDAWKTFGKFFRAKTGNEWGLSFIVGDRIEAEKVEKGREKANCEREDLDRDHEERDREKKMNENGNEKGDTKGKKRNGDEGEDEEEEDKEDDDDDLGWWKYTPPLPPPLPPPPTAAITITTTTSSSAAVLVLD